jgi:GNAT superfamily N-acetyltransferase
VTRPLVAELAPRLKRAAFVDVPEILRLIQRALERGSRQDYRPAQRRAIHMSYAMAMFVDVIGTFETVVAESGGALVGMAQLDPGNGRLRALFVDGPVQGQGIGRLLLAHVESIARREGCRRIHGAMSRNAVAFYAAAGFRPCDGPDRLKHFGEVVPVVSMEKILRT